MPLSADLQTVKSWLNNHAQQLKRPDLELLLSSLFEKDRSWLIAHGDQVLSVDQLKTLSEQVEKLLLGMPVAYLIGKKEFWSLELEVNEHTLIPRPETEQIIELALLLSPPPKNILDLGTGTGAIALALAKEFPQAHIMASDCFQETLAVAKKNAVFNDLNRVNFQESDWFSDITGSFDLIVSNPPYIDPEDKHLNDLVFEPRHALVADNQGMKDLLNIIHNAPRYLNPMGWLLLEHGYDQGSKVADALRQARFRNVKTHQDLASRDRITVGQWCTI